jgi:outer membrane protein assembly factor BamB
MNGFEIVVSSARPSLASRPTRRDASPALAKVVPLRGTAEASAPTTSRPRETVDILVGGVNVTARVEPDQAPCVLRDLAFAIVDLACGVRRRAVVRFYDTPWELGLERLDRRTGAELSISVVRTGADVEVAVEGRRTGLADAIAGTSSAIARLLDPSAPRSPLADVLGKELAMAREALDRLEPLAIDDETDEVLAIAEPEAGLRCGFGAELPLRAAPHGKGAASGVEIADLHALLGRGRLRIVVRGRTKELGEVHTFLATERLVELAKTVLDAWERGRSLHSRVLLGSGSDGPESWAGPAFGVRLEPEGALTISVVGRSIPRGGGAPERSPAVFPSLEGPDFVDAVVELGRALGRAIVRRDRTQASNLRLLALRRRVKDLSERLREVARPVGPFGESDLVNPHRESYAAYLATRGPSRSVVKAPLRNGSEGAPRKLKYEPRWTAEVPGIDLRATFLCGDRLILSGATQTACVDRVDGHPIWKLPTVRATSLPTPGGLARLRGDGRLELRDFGDGSVIWSSACAPRSRGTPAACTVVAPGLPRLLIATDGDRHLVAFDLTSGEPRWRYAMSRPGTIRIRRAGRLLVVSSDEAQLVALDAVDGRVIWRVRDRLRFAAPAIVEREDLVAIAGEPGGLSRLHLLDAISGARRYERPLDAAAATDLAPIVSGSVVLILTRDRRGLGVVAIDRATGVERWSAAPGTWPIGTSPLGFDDLVVLNLPTGETVALVAATGETAWRHVFEAPVSGDAPRRLEPVLRSGALFVPQDKVRVLRPADGEIVGVVGPSDLVPDLMRVDERCDVYVAEESGHVAAFAASTRLGVVDGGVRARLSVAR